MFGIEHFVAIINPPQSSILTVGKLAKRPAVDGSGRIVAATDPARIGATVDPAVSATLGDIPADNFVEHRAGDTAMIAVVVGGIPGGWAYVRTQTRSAFDGAVVRRNQTIAVVLLADGCDVWLLRTTDQLAARRQAVSVRDRVAATRDDLAYPQFLTWRGFLQREPPRRPEPDRPAAPPSARTDKWKYAFTGTRDSNGFVYLPPSRVSMTSGEIDQMEQVRMADVPATIATFTVDRLAFSLSPPVVAAIIDFDGGGRFQCELTDVDPATVKIGDRVEMTFRRLYTSGGVHNYFWKARPLTAEPDESGR
jgi:uncharacterized OB-fold protein